MPSSSTRPTRPYPRLATLVTTGVALVGGLLALGTPTASAAALDRPSGASTSRVTLITGDVVTVTATPDGTSTATVRPQDLATGGIRSLTLAGQHYVIPAAAQPYLASGRLDRELFNVTRLVADGYTDEERATLPVIVEYADDAITLDGTRTTRTLSSIDGAAVLATKGETSDLWADLTDSSRPGRLRPGVTRVWLDGRVEAHLADSVAQIGAPTAWAEGYDGTGATVAVLDSGIDADHPDLADQLDEAVSFVPGESVTDVNGHGTHVASTVLGTGAASDGVERGVAPGARLVVGKVLGDDGFGQDSWIIDGMEWAAARADVVNMSLGSPVATDGSDPMAQALDALTEETGALFVVSAGNSGAPGSIGSPGSADAALTVGAVDSTDALAWFSSMGPRFGDQALKPDLVAPGVEISAARSQFSSDGSGSYVSLSGTSMAAPHVAGAAAVLVQRHPAWGADRLKDALMSTSVALPDYSAYQVGAGRVDVPAAVLGDVHATGSVDFGFDRWPHGDEAPVTRTITYRNTSADAVSLSLATTVTDESGSTAEGLLDLSASEVTVPAEGSAEVSVTLDPLAAEKAHRYSGAVVASQEGTTTAVRTVLGFVKEDERYDLTITATDRDGEPTLAYVDLIGGPEVYEPLVVDGSLTVRRPAATYSVMTLLDVDTDTDHQGVALIGDPQVVLDRDRSVTLDASTANRVSARVPGRAADETEASHLRMTYVRDLGAGPIESGLLMPVWVDRLYAAPTERVTDGSFEMLTRWRLRQPLLALEVDGVRFDVISMPGTALLEGRAELPLVDGGEGRPADLDGLDLDGAAVFVRRADDVDPYERTLAAARAGAALVVVAGNTPAEHNQWIGGPLGEDPGVPSAAISGTEGDALQSLLDEGPQVARVVGRPSTRWVYDLQDPHPGRIPASVAFRPTVDDLARIRAEYTADRATPAGEFRWDFRPYTVAGIGFPELLNLPTVRNEWVSTAPGTSWFQGVTQLDSMWDQRSRRESYAPGERTVRRWFSPVVRPRLGDGYWKPERQGNWFAINLPAWADSGPGHTGDMYSDPSTRQRVRLTHGSALIKESAEQAVWTEAPTGQASRYELVTTAERDPSRWSTSLRTRTAWSFRSAYAPELDHLPLLSVDYGLTTDLLGRVERGPTSLDLTVVPVAGARFAGRTITDARLWVSVDDGATWDRTSVRRTGPTSWAAVVPGAPAGGAVSLKVFAADIAGNTVRQSIVRAYLVR